MSAVVRNCKEQALHKDTQPDGPRSNESTHIAKPLVGWNEQPDGELYPILLQVPKE
jgi:hypothetical protein